MGMAAGVEVRVPLLDINLVRFAGSLPVNFKQRGPVGKWIFKKSMEPYLPKHIIYRPKTGFGAPLRHWLRHDLREMMYDLLSETSVSRRGLFCHNQVKNLLALEQEGKVDAAYPLFSLMCIELWCRMFIDAPLPEVRN
jgi:asparagine synthase (glutamine-hydrolysing)